MRTFVTDIAQREDVAKIEGEVFRVRPVAWLVAGSTLVRSDPLVEIEVSAFAGG